jgi:hypothetical protein
MANTIKPVANWTERLWRTNNVADSRGVGRVYCNA